MAEPVTPETLFAPAARADVGELQRSHRDIKAQTLMSDLLEAFPGPAMILNSFRQVVTINRRAMLMTGLTESEALGKRPGELFGCRHAQEGPSGCGTSAACSVCGAVQAILQAQSSGEATVRECRVPALAFEGICLELEIHATPITVTGHRFIVCALRDISHYKRGQTFERLFFHDILNSLGMVRGLIDQLLKTIPAGSGQDAILHDALKAEVRHLTDEILAQRHLQEAERGDLRLMLSAVAFRGLLESIVSSCSTHDAASTKTITLIEPVPAFELVTDERLLRRILANLIKNAVEAVPRGQTVTIKALGEKGAVRFEIWNPGAMTDEVQHQIFHKSFSTKGVPGRGLGTYSVKLFGERYLRGEVSFTSSAESGTTFSFRHPLDLSDKTSHS